MRNLPLPRLLKRALFFSLLVQLLACCAWAQQGSAPAPPPPPPGSNITPDYAPLNPALPTLFVAGDSTAKNGKDLGWGDHLASFFDTSRINVENRARGGRSSRSFYHEGLWNQLLARLKPGDFVLIQFGHNDGGAVDNPKGRGSLPGLGDETQTVTRPDGQQEVVHTYGWYVKKYISDTRAKGATPILLTVTVRNIWTDGKVERAMGHYDEWDKQIAAAEQVPLVDVTNIVADEYERMGQAKVAPLYPIDHTHSSPAGAKLNAAAVVAGLKCRKIEPLVNDLSAKGKAVQPKCE